MEYLSGTFLTVPEATQKQLETLVLGPNSGMDQHISNIRRGEWVDAPIIYAKTVDSAVAWAICSPVPRFWFNTTQHPNRPEVQLFVHPEYRRLGIGRAIISMGRTLWGVFSTCPWDRGSNEFFKAIR